jgi:hypothetical protein
MRVKVIRVMAGAILPLALLMCYLPAVAQQVPYQVDPAALRSLTNRVTTDVGRSQSLLIDPRILEQIFSSATLYVENFCAAPAENCAEKLSDNTAFRTIVHGYLRDLRSLPKVPIQAFADRLANGKLAMTGWPSYHLVEVGLLEIPPSMRGIPLRMRFATESISLGMGASALLAMPGNVTLEATIGDNVRLASTEVETGKSTRLALSDDRMDIVASGPLKPLPSAFCTNIKQPENRGPFALFNEGRVTIAEDDHVRTANEAPFLKQSAVDIFVRSDTSIVCDAVCLFSLSSLFADAIATWRVGCSRCDPNAMVTLSTMKTIWIDWRAARRLRLASKGTKVNLSLAHRHAEEDSVTQVHHYAHLSGDGTVRKQLCQTPNDSAPWVRVAKQLACSSQSPASQGALRPFVSLMAGDTTCGASAIACGLPSAGVEISLKKYRYALPADEVSKEIVIGPNVSGPILDMRHVILHEVGHWFGIPHAQVGGADQLLDVMSEGYDDGEGCVAPHSLRMISNAGDLRWEYRIKSGGALREPHKPMEPK